MPSLGQWVPAPRGRHDQGFDREFQQRLATPTTGEYDSFGGEAQAIDQGRKLLPVPEWGHGADLEAGDRVRLVRRGEAESTSGERYCLGQPAHLDARPADCHDQRRHPIGQKHKALYDGRFAYAHRPGRGCDCGGRHAQIDELGIDPAHLQEPSQIVVIELDVGDHAPQSIRFVEVATRSR